MRLLKERIPAVAKGIVDVLIEKELIDVADDARGSDGAAVSCHQSPDDTHQQIEMPPVVGVDQHAF